MVRQLADGVDGLVLQAGASEEFGRADAFEHACRGGRGASVPVVVRDASELAAA
jgi:hypothetical protein